MTVGQKFTRNWRYAWEIENLTEAEYDELASGYRDYIDEAAGVYRAESDKRLAKIGQLPYPIANWVSTSGQLYRVLGTRRETYVIVNSDDLV